MRVMLKLTLDCRPDAAWRALHSPAVLREVVAPWLDFTSLEPGGLPTAWTEGRHRLQPRAFGRVPIGEEVVDLSHPGGLPPGVRMLRDGGGALTGPFALFDRWDHRMAVSALPDGRTLYRDRLVAHAGALDAVAWYPTWAFWQWRGRRLRQLAPTWSFDPPGTADAAATRPDEAPPPGAPARAATSGRPGTYGRAGTSDRPATSARPEGGTA